MIDYTETFLQIHIKCYSKPFVLILEIIFSQSMDKLSKKPDQSYDDVF